MGSANLTGSGYGGNIELVHEFAPGDERVTDWFEDLWHRCERPNDEWLRLYEERQRDIGSKRVPLAQMPAPEPPRIDNEIDRGVGPCYRTVRHELFSKPFKETADELLAPLQAKIHRGGGRAFWRDGSISLELSGRKEVAAKVLIYEADLCRPVGEWPDLRDGVYVLVRADGLTSDAIWAMHRIDLESFGMRRDVTIGLDPNRLKRFADHRLTEADSLERTADLIANFTNLS